MKLTWVVVTLPTLFAAACMSTAPSLSFDTSAAVAGPADGHCGGRKQGTSADACKAPAETPEAGPDGGLPPAEPPYGDTMPGTEADDDDCKYHLAWSSTAVGRNKNVTFRIVVTRTIDGKPATDAKPYVEGYLDVNTPAPNTSAVANEISPGTYTIGPIQFDGPGKWTVRFHLYSGCGDARESAHGHAAFFVQVP
jgi:hypothetical protein